MCVSGSKTREEDKMGQIKVTVESMSIEGKEMYPVDTSFWEDLWDHFTNDLEEVVIHCLNEEMDPCEEVNQIAYQTINEYMHNELTVMLNEENRLFLRNSSVDPVVGGLKWNRMLFYKDGKVYLEINHYGSEVIFYQAEEDMIEQVEFILPTTTEVEYIS
jgi:hypothetical protein